jgi:hypothetical protein
LQKACFLIKKSSIKLTGFHFRLFFLQIIRYAGQMLSPDLTWNKVLIVSDKKTAELLSHGTQTITMLAPFLGKTSTTKSASLESGIKLNVLAYWVHKFFDAGILVLVKTEKRGGSPVHHYRAAADEFLVPIDLIPSVSDEELMLRMQQQEYRMFNANVVSSGRKFAADWYLHYFCDTDSKNWTFRPKNISDPEMLLQRPIHDWLHLELEPEEAELLRQDLWTLREKYSALDKRGQNLKRFILHLGLVEKTR